MAQISRLRDSEISNGNLINADDIDAELNQLVNESNSQDNRLTAIESSSMTLAGVKTFSSAPRTDQVDERTADAGVTIDGVLLKDGTVKPVAAADPASPSNGMLWYHATDHVLRARLNGNTRTVALKEELPFPKGYINGPAPLYASAATLTVPARLKARSSDNTADIEVASNITLSLAVSGAAGLDSGSEATNTWYYVYLIKKSSDGTVSAVFSTVNEANTGSITLPSGYDLKRQLPLAVRNDASGNIVPFRIAEGWPQRPRIIYETDFRRNAGSANPTEVLTAGTATSFTSVAASSFVPPIASACEVFVSTAHDSYYVKLRKTGSGLSDGIFWTNGYAGDSRIIPLAVNASQQFDYLILTGTSLDVSVFSFTVTEVN